MLVMLNKYLTSSEYCFDSVNIRVMFRIIKNIHKNRDFLRCLFCSFFVLRSLLQRALYSYGCKKITKQSLLCKKVATRREKLVPQINAFLPVVLNLENRRILLILDFFIQSLETIEILQPLPKMYHQNSNNIKKLFSSLLLVVRIPQESILQKKFLMITVNLERL